MHCLPSDEGAVLWMMKIHDLADQMDAAQLIHIAEFSGQHGSRGRQLATKVRANIETTNAYGLVYALKMGFFSIDEVEIDASVFA